MTVTSEEKVLDAILMWCMQASEICSWATVDELLSSLTPEQIFRDRLPSIDNFLPFVRFPLMPSSLLHKVMRLEYQSQSGCVLFRIHLPCNNGCHFASLQLDKSKLSSEIPVFGKLVSQQRNLREQFFVVSLLFHV